MTDEILCRTVITPLEAPFKHQYQLLSEWYVPCRPVIPAFGKQWEQTGGQPGLCLQPGLHKQFPIQPELHSGTLTQIIKGGEEGWREDLVAHTCNLHTWEAEAGGSGIQASMHYTIRLYLRNKITGYKVGSKLWAPEFGFPTAQVKPRWE